MAQSVLVKHDPAAAPPAALVAALNGAMLDASLAPPRTQAKVRGCAVECAHARACSLLLCFGRVSDII